MTSMMMTMHLFFLKLRGLLHLLLLHLLLLLYLFSVNLHVELNDGIEVILLVFKLGVPVVLDLAVRAAGNHVRNF